MLAYLARTLSLVAWPLTGVLMASLLSGAIRGKEHPLVVCSAMWEEEKTLICANKLPT